MFGFDEKMHLNSLGIAGFLLPMSLNGTLWKGCSIQLVHGGQAAKIGIESALLAKGGLQDGMIFWVGQSLMTWASAM